MNYVIDLPVVHRHLAGDLRPPKSAITAAQKIESMIARQGWSVGNVIGSEQTVRRQFGLGHRVTREAIRVLQSRSAVYGRRGPQGGLVVGSPSRSMAIEAIADYLEAAAVTAGELIEARTVLCKMADTTVAAPAIRTRDVFVAAIEEAERRRVAVREAQAQLPHLEEIAARILPAVSVDDIRPARIARRLLLEIEHMRHAGELLWLGSEEQLCERHGVGHAVLRQALRILDARGVTESRRGRFGGIKAQAPSVRGPIEATLSYLSREPLRQSDLFSWSMSFNDILNTLAVERWSDGDQCRFESLLLRLRGLDDNWVPVLMCALWDACGNRALALVARCVAAYQIRFVPDGHDVTQSERDIYQVALIERARAMSSRDRRGARDAYCEQTFALEKMLERSLNRGGHA
jgi:DNA-binding FadR family transcriptional regulator